MAHFEKKKQFLIIFVLYFPTLNQKSCLQQIQIFLWNFSFSNLLRKVIFLSNSDFFRIKREIFREFPPKCFKTTEKHSLAACGSFRGEKKFLFIFFRFYCFVQKGLFTTNPNFPLDLPLFKFVEKNKLSKYFWASFWESIVWLKWEVLSEFSPKCFKTTEKNSLAVCGTFWGEKQFLLIFVPFYWFVQKQLFKQIQISSRFVPFKIVEKNKISKYFWASFWDGYIFG